MHEYLLQNKNNPNLSITPTWISNQDIAISHKGYYQMPLNINNIDLCVLANFIHWSTKFIIERDQDILKNEQFKRNYEDNFDYALWAISSKKAFKRYDIGMLYYPSP